MTDVVYMFFPSIFTISKAWLGTAVSQQPTPIEYTGQERKAPSKRDVENNFHINS